MVCAKAGGLEAAFCDWGSADALVLMLEQVKDPSERKERTKGEEGGSWQSFVTRTIHLTGWGH